MGRGGGGGGATAHPLSTAEAATTRTTPFRVRTFSTGTLLPYLSNMSAMPDVSEPIQPRCHWTWLDKERAGAVPVDRALRLSPTRNFDQLDTLQGKMSDQLHTVPMQRRPQRHRLRQHPGRLNELRDLLFIRIAG